MLQAVLVKQKSNKQVFHRRLEENYDSRKNME